LGQVLRNLSFVIATVALVMGVHGAQWLRDVFSFDLGFRLERMSIPLLSMNAALMALACLLFLAGFALADGTRSRSGVAT
jgi:hypothetical protein